MAVTIYTSDFILYKLRTIVVQINCIKTLENKYGRSDLIYFLLIKLTNLYLYSYKSGIS